MEMFLASDGSNLSSVLYGLKSSHERIYRKIIEAVKVIEPKLDLINFRAPNPEQVYLIFEDDRGKQFIAQGLSDGTLRYLALCTIFILYRQVTQDLSFSPLLIIEEPENGIFVGHLKPLFEKLDPTGTEGQYLFTSHSPYFIDLFEECLDGIWKAKSYGTHSDISHPDRSRIEDNLGKFSLGEMHYSGLLE